MANETYEAIAAAHGLEGRIFNRYIAYMRRRWGDTEDERVKCLVGYAGEWAERFKGGREYAASDFEGQHILKEIEFLGGAKA